MSYLKNDLTNPNAKHTPSRPSAAYGNKQNNMTSNSNSIHAIIAGV